MNRKRRLFASPQRADYCTCSNARKTQTSILACLQMTACWELRLQLIHTSYSVTSIVTCRQHLYSNTGRKAPSSLKLPINTGERRNCSLPLSVATRRGHVTENIEIYVASFVLTGAIKRPTGCKLEAATSAECEKNSDGSIEVKIFSLSVTGIPRTSTWLPAQARRDRWVSTALTHVGNTFDVAKSGCLAAVGDVPERSSCLSCSNGFLSAVGGGCLLIWSSFGFVFLFFFQSKCQARLLTCRPCQTRQPLCL